MTAPPALQRLGRPLRRRTAHGRSRQRGTALLLAMVILTLVATVAAGMVWQQERAIRVEAAERARTQGAWILAGALDWARLLLREDMRSGSVDHLGEPWAVPLAEARLSTFLAADRDPTADDGPAAFLSGSIEDLQARYNVVNLINDEGEIAAAEVVALQRLADLAGAPSDTAQRIAAGLVAALGDGDGDGAGGGDSAAVLLPRRYAQLTWLGISPELLQRLAPYVTLLPQSTPVNVNTAPREVLTAAIDGLDLGSAERIVQRRARRPFQTLDELKRELPPDIELADSRVAVGSRYFAIVGRLRLDDRVLEQHSVVERRGSGASGEVVTAWTERRSTVEGTGS
jgi:general secretion pathway protein K